MIDQEYECYCDDCESNGIVPLDYPQWKLLQGKVGGDAAFDIDSGAKTRKCRYEDGGSPLP